MQVSGERAMVINVMTVYLGISCGQLAGLRSAADTVGSGCMNGIRVVNLTQHNQVTHGPLKTVAKKPLRNTSG